jgi:hypothetical protein
MIMDVDKEPNAVKAARFRLNILKSEIVIGEV